MRIIQNFFGYFFIGLTGWSGLAILFLPLHFILRKRMPLSRQIAYFLCELRFDYLEDVLSTFVHNLMFRKRNHRHGTYFKHHSIPIITKAGKWMSKENCADIANI